MAQLPSLSLSPLADSIRACRICPLAPPSCKRPVPGEPPHPTMAYVAGGRFRKVAFVGEAPGQTENNLGRPFVGQAGDEADALVRRFFKAPLSAFFVSNILKCRPPDNRDPLPLEVDACTPWLLRELDDFAPEWIIAVGAYASRYFLGRSFDLRAEYGHPYTWPHSPKVGILPVFHPALMLHDPGSAHLVFRSFEKAAGVILGELGKATPRRRGTLDPYEGKEMYRLIETERDFRDAMWTKPPLAAVDTEVEGFEPKEGDVFRSTPWCVTFSSCDGTGYMIMADNEPTLTLLADYLAHPSVSTGLHNASFDLPVLAMMDIHPAKVLDSMIAAQILQDIPAGLKPLARCTSDMALTPYGQVISSGTIEKATSYLIHALEYTWKDPPAVLEEASGKPKLRQPTNVSAKAARLLGDIKAHLEDPASSPGFDPIDRWLAIPWEEGRKQATETLGPLTRAHLSDIPFKEALHYACRDADATFRVWPSLKARLESLELMPAFELDMEVLPLLSEMSAAGIEIDRPYLGDLLREYEATEARLVGDLAFLTSKAVDLLSPYKVGSPLYRGIIAGKSVNPLSSLQVAHLLYDVIGEPIPKIGGKKKSKTKRPTDSKALSAIKARGRKPLAVKAASLIVEARELSKMNALIRDLLARSSASSDGRIHTSFRQGLVSGRLATSSPNLMAVPKRTEIGKAIRRGFIARPGHVLVANDFGQMDLVIAAHVSGDANLCRMFNEGLDPHLWAASRMFGVPEGQVTKVQRQVAKTVGFAVLNGMQAEGLLAQFDKYGLAGYTLHDAKNFRNGWFAAFPGCRRLFEDAEAEARRNGFVRAPGGRLRWGEGVRAVTRRVSSEVGRQMGNTIVQGGTAWAIKEAMRQICPHLRTYRAIPLLQVHDELIFDVPKPIAVDFARCLGRVMVNCVKLRVPITATPSIGPNWADLEPLEKEAA